MCNPMAAQALPGLDLEGDTIIENKYTESWTLWIVMAPSCAPDADNVYCLLLTTR